MREFLDGLCMYATSFVDCPMPSTNEMHSDPTPLTQEQQKWFESTVGSLHWFSIIMRYDICYAVRRLGRHCRDPTVGHLKAMKRLISYLLQHPCFSISTREVIEQDELMVFTDSDHAGDTKETTHSHTGTLVYLNGMPVFWTSRRQKDTTFSSTAAEIMACSETLRDARAVTHRAQEMGIDLPDTVQVRLDSKGAVSFSLSTCVDTKLRGVWDLREGWIKMLRDRGFMQPIKITSEENAADILTKCLPERDFKKRLETCKTIQ